MKFGLFDELLTGQRIDSASGVRSDLEEHFQEAELADRLGYDYYFFPEQQCSEFYGTASAAIVCTVLAQRTKRIRFGPLVYVLPLNEPGKLAGEVSFLDQLSNGRMEVGLGSGSLIRSFQIFNVPWEEKAPRTFEALEVLMNAWTKDIFTHRGKFYTYVDYRIGYSCFQKPYPRLWYPTRAMDTTKWLAENNISTVQWEFTPTDLIRQIFEYHKKICLDLGKDPESLQRAVQRKVVIADTDAEAKQIAKDDYETYWNLFRVRMKADRDKADVGVSGTSITVSERVNHIGNFGTADQENLVIVGSPITVAQKIKELTNEVAANTFMFTPDFGPKSHKNAKNCIKLFAEKVIPEINN